MLFAVVCLQRFANAGYLINPIYEQTCNVFPCALRVSVVEHLRSFADLIVERQKKPLGERLLNDRLELYLDKQRLIGI